jgi:hypothetical protein
MRAALGDESRVDADLRFQGVLIRKADQGTNELTSSLAGLPLYLASAARTGGALPSERRVDV